jgi:hypothetical protein
VANYGLREARISRHAVSVYQRCLSTIGRPRQFSTSAPQLFFCPPHAPLPRNPTRTTRPLDAKSGVSALLVALSLIATLLGGLARAPWWFWLVGAAALALLMATDPSRLRASYAEARGLNSVPLLLGDLKSLATGCLMSAGAFALGSALSLTLPV